MYKEHKKGVYYILNDIPTSECMISYLMEESKKHNLKLARMCLHKSHESILMAMLILVRDNYIYPPHRHSWKDEVYTILRGSCDYYEYTESGSVVSCHRLQEGSTFLNNKIGRASCRERV